MKGKIFLISFICTIFLLVSPSCKSPSGTDLPTKFGAFVEIMYQRTKPVVDNNATGPKGFMIWSKEQGGKTITPLVDLGNDRWMTKEAVFLYYNSNVPYWIHTLDAKVTGVYATVGETFYARIQGTSEWKRLPCEFEPDSAKGLAAKFWLYDGIITVPVQF